MELHCKAADARIKKRSWASILWFPFLICPLCLVCLRQKLLLFFFLFGSIFSALSLSFFKPALFDLYNVDLPYSRYLLKPGTSDLKVENKNQAVNSTWKCCHGVLGSC